jgi:hypothetical protein
MICGEDQEVHATKLISFWLLTQKLYRGASRKRNVYLLVSTELYFLLLMNCESAVQTVPSINKLERTFK